MLEQASATRSGQNNFGGFGRALSNRNYRIYWTGQGLHAQGWWLYRIAAGWLMFDLTHSPAWLGLSYFFWRHRSWLLAKSPALSATMPGTGALRLSPSCSFS